MRNPIVNTISLFEGDQTCIQYDVTEKYYFLNQDSNTTLLVIEDVRLISAFVRNTKAQLKLHLRLMVAFKRDFRNGDKHPRLKSEKLMHISDQCTHL